ncbi:MAG: relaxase domain-containing protein [Rhodospirillaceae bacterium]|nr:relaxase domain-containing protein [Rhodospirillaceae bacterium]MYI49810.1 relaxase domain-containing protein [Rhodospirillaceae bacterium]
MVASIGAVASPSQGASYYERDGYYAKDSPEHLAASAWAGKGAAELGLRGPVDPGTFKAVLEGAVPDGSGKRLGRCMGDGEIRHRPGRDLTFSAPKSVSLAALVGGDARIVEAHDRAVGRALDWFETNAAETRTQDPATGRMVRTGDQKTVIATFRHETSRNLDPALHTHSVIANMLHGPDGKWRTMANESLYASKMLLGALYRSELAGELAKLDYGIERTHADGRFEIAGVSRHIVEAFSTRRAEIEAAMADRGLGTTAENQPLARRAALMTRAAKRDVDRAELREIWEKQAAELGFEAKALVAEAMERGPAGPAKARGGAKDAGKGDESTGVRQADLFEHAARPDPAREAVGWALAHLSERDAVFARTDLLAAALAYSPGAASIGEIERAANDLQREGRLHDAPAFEHGGGLTTERAVADERETIALMRAGAGRGKAPMKGWTVDRHLRKGPLTAGQKQAVRLILSEKDRTVGVQGFAGTGKTRMLHRARALAEKKGWRMVGLAPSASAVQTLTAESGIRSETLQRFLARNAGVAEGRLTKKGAKTMRAAFAKTVLVVDEGSLASTVQARDLLRIAGELRIPKLVLVGDAKQLDAVDAGKPFAQLQQAGMKTAVMDAILRQRDPDLKAAVEASLAGEIGRAFDKLGANVAEVKADNIAGAVAARWLKLSQEERERTGVMAPSHELREGINGHIRERLVREGCIAGPALETQRLVSKGYTNAEKALASNYAPGDVVAFHRSYKRLGVEKGDELRVERVDRAKRLVHLEGRDGATVAWKPSEIGGRRGGTEVYRAETVELRAGDRIRWTRNDKGLGLVNSGGAEVLNVRNGRVTFALEDGRRLTRTPGDPQLRHLDHAWASTVHAFQGRTVDNVIAAMEANHPSLTTAKAFYVEISRARDRAELVTDDAQALKERLEAVTGERLSALEGIGERVELEREREHDRDGKASPERERTGPATSTPPAPEREFEPEASRQKAPEPEPPDKSKGVEMDMGL